MRILFAGGGTGGHLIPAINIASSLRNRLKDAEFLFVGIKGGMEKSIVEKNNFAIEEIEVVGLRRDLSGMVDFSKKIMRGFAQADRVVRGFGPEVVVGTGGYLSAPVVLAGKRRRARVIIQEQNIYPGLATRFLARFADKICLAFEGSRRYFQGMRNIVVTGNPLRSDLVIVEGNGYLNEFGLQADRKVLLVTGGSRGAQSINEAMVDFIGRGLLPEDWQILWQAGADKFDKLATQVEKLNFAGRLLPFIDSMPKAYSVTDLMMCRAGAMTLSELLVLGLPALLVPYPHATANHQMKNALDLQGRGAVAVIADDRLRTGDFDRVLINLMKNELRRKELSQNARSMGNSRGTEAVTEEIIRLI